MIKSIMRKLCPSSTESDDRTGEWREYHDDGSLEIVENYLGGKPHGEWKRFSYEGFILFEGHYDHGKRNGKFRWFNYSKLPREEKNYKEGYLHGIYKEYNFKGEIEISGLYDKNLKSGEWIKNYKEVKITENYTEGNLIQKKTYDRKGILLSEWENNKGIIKYYENGQVKSTREPSGFSTTFYPNGNLKTKGSFLIHIPDKKTGLWMTYFENGNIQSEIEYYTREKDQTIREWKEYHPNCQIKILKKIIGYNEEDIGEFLQYHECGQISEKGRYSSPKKVGFIQFGSTYKKGKWRTFFTNGKLKEETNHSSRIFQGGNLEGERQSYYENGGLKELLSYSGGKKHGNYLEYYLNGQIKTSGIFSKGVKVGLWKSFYESGTIFSLADFSNKKDIEDYGRFHIGYKEYYENGNLQAEGAYSVDPYEFHFSQEKKSNYYKWYYPNGVLGMEGQYLSGERISEWREYYPNGTLKMVGSYVDEKLRKKREMESYNYPDRKKMGDWIFYNEDGDIIKKENYWSH